MVAAEWPHFIRSMGVVLADTDIRERVWAEHAAILDEIVAGRPAAAERAAQRARVERAGEETARRIEQLASVA